MKYWLVLISIATAAECYTKLDLFSSNCDALCKRDEFEFGYYELRSDSCICANRYKYKEMNKRPLKVHGMPGTTW